MRKPLLSACLLTLALAPDAFAQDAANANTGTGITLTQAMTYGRGRPCPESAGCKVCSSTGPGHRMHRKTLLALSLALALPAIGAAALAQTSPQAPVYDAVKTPYPGTIQLDVDATNLSQRVFQVKQRIPVAAGPVTLLFPKWLPGNHGTSGCVWR